MLDSLIRRKVVGGDKTKSTYLRPGRSSESASFSAANRNFKALRDLQVSGLTLTRPAFTEFKRTRQFYCCCFCLDRRVSPFKYFTKDLTGVGVGGWVFFD